jgi:hypothetical protein
METFGSRNPYLALAASACIVCSIIFTWYHLTLDYRLTADDIAKKEAEWEATYPEQYRYQITSSCVLSSTFEVLYDNGKYTSNRLQGRQYFTASLTMSGLFKELEKAQQSAANMSAEFDPIYGFPTIIKIDWDSAIVDDECIFEVSSFKVF